MYVFSVNAKAKSDMKGLAQGQQVPFIVYINSVDLKGAEKLCQLHLFRAGFEGVEIEKHKQIKNSVLADKKVVAAYKGLREALEQGYSIHLFDEA